jgi:hypothetical protein
MVSKYPASSADGTVVVVVSGATVVGGAVVVVVVVVATVVVVVSSPDEALSPHAPNKSTMAARGTRRRIGFTFLLRVQRKGIGVAAGTHKG